MDSLVTVILAVSVAVHALLLLYVQMRGRDVHAGRSLLTVTISLSLAVAIIVLLPREVGLMDAGGRSLALTLALIVFLIPFGVVVMTDLQRTATSSLIRAWLVLGVAWLLGAAATGVSGQPIAVGQPGWLVGALAAPDTTSLVLLGGGALASLILLFSAFYAFYASLLPEVANRALFWVLDIAVVLMGIVLTISGSQGLVLLGVLSLQAGITGMTYGQTTFRVFDIRNGLNRALRTLFLAAVTGLLIYGALYIESRLELGNTAEGAVVLAGLALAVALLYVPVRQLVEGILNRLISDSVTDVAQATRKYSQQVSQGVELDQLIQASSDTLSTVMRARRSGLILVNDGVNGGVELMVMPRAGFADMQGKKVAVAKTSPIYQQLTTHHAPLSQFDLEFSPKYRAISDAELQFFRELQMSAYAPVVVEMTLIGILACGPKANDAPFYPRDLELLATMATQTGVALRNARLLADLRHLNHNISSLNKEMEEANQQLEKLDAVKTDFVTIASHELRTPLAQLRGYTDIVDALNEQGMLDQDQIAGMVANLRKATERMEELIAAMLDVSQLDVNAMDLRFTQTTPETVIRMAIEPLNDAIKQRKLSLSARGLRGLPMIEADMQRLVQAFRNIVVNAIKFTPDGGRIEITAVTHPAEAPGGKDHILVAITDTGVGIEKNNLDLIFQKFFRAYDPGLHSTGTYKFMGAGPGLGLTIAKGVIEGHGGKIWAESPGHSTETFPGTTFYVLLPVTPPETARRVMTFEGQASETVSSEPTLAQSRNS
jgi:signal transduction histidine kinase